MNIQLLVKKLSYISILTLGLTCISPNISAQEAKPDLFDYYMQEGYRAFKSNDCHYALSLFKEALSYRQNDPYATVAIQNTALCSDKQVYETNIPPFKPANDPFSFFMDKGYTATERHNYQEAKDYFEMALKLRPGNIYAVNGISQVSEYLRNNSYSGPQDDRIKTISRGTNYEKIILAMMEAYASSYCSARRSGSSYDTAHTLGGGAAWAVLVKFVSSLRTQGLILEDVSKRLEEFANVARSTCSSSF